MNVSPVAIVFTVLGGLILAGIIAWIKKPRLILLVPRLFTHSTLTSKGQVAEISVFNRGFKTEESIELLLNPALHYELVGTNNPDANIIGKKLSIPRIGPGDEFTALILIDVGVFTQNDIVSCTSKDTKGVFVAKYDNLTPTGPQRISLVAAFVGFPLFLFAVDYLYDADKKDFQATIAGATKDAEEAVIRAATEMAKRPQIEHQGWKIASYTDTGPLFDSFKGGLVRVTTGSITRRKDVVTVPIVVYNGADEPVTYRLSINGTASQDRISHENKRSDELLLMSGTQREIQLSVIVPVDGATKGDKSILIEGSLQSQRAFLSISRVIVVE